MPGRSFLQIPGPTLVPERVVRAISQPVIDHRGPKFPALLKEILQGLKTVFQTSQGEILLYPGSGTGAWESCLVNTLSPGDRALGCVNGHFAMLACQTAESFGIDVERLDIPYGEGIAGRQIEERLARDKNHQIKAVLAVHNETSTGVTSDIAAVRAAIDSANHPALLLVDAVSSLGCIELRFDEWKIDVATTAAQKGLMLPPGMGLLAVSKKALEASRSAKCPRSFWNWAPVLERNARGEFPYTPATTLLFGLRESLAVLAEEGLPNVFRRHARLGGACRRAIQAMGLKLFAKNPAEYSSVLTAVSMPEGLDSEAFIAHAHERFELSLGIGLGKVKGKIFRIGHLGSFNELELLAALAGVEMSLKTFGVDVPVGHGLAAAESYLLETATGAAGCLL
jgi:alanine-glyoxylate transaminase/serine-glyoxylate transaminase/serine-pyruvate transaminase